MDTLAYTHVAVHYEELNSSSELSTFSNIKIKSLKAVKSIAIAVACITAEVFAGTAAQAATDHKSLKTVNDKPVTAPSQLATRRITVDGDAKKATLARDGLPNHTQVPLQYGQVQLINDKPYPKIIYFREHGEGSTTRFAYLPGCTKRTLMGTYNNRWEYSGDKIAYTTFGTLAQRRFTLATSHLQKQDNGLTCRTPSLFTSLREVNNVGQSEWHEQEGEGIVAEPVSVAGEVLEATWKGLKNSFGKTAKEVQKSGTAKAIALNIGEKEGGNAGRAYAASLTNATSTPTVTELNNTRRYIKLRIETQPNYTAFEAGAELIEQGGNQLRSNLQSSLQFVAKGDQSLVAQRANAIASEVIEVAEKGVWTEDFSIALKRKLKEPVERGGCGYVNINADLAVDAIRAYVEFVNTTRVEMGKAGSAPAARMISADRQGDLSIFENNLRQLQCADYDRIPSVDGSLVVSQQ
ncbi:hypothetical protein [Nostoc sp.]|uniref:hypothetical protein n=1 Tax=Nostoc sp. TaxID=1180 RepID=UPI002FF9DA30